MKSFRPRNELDRPGGDDDGGRNLTVDFRAGRRSNATHASTIDPIDRRTTRHAGYAVSLRARKRIEEAFGWIKTVASLRRTKLHGLKRVDWSFTFAAAAYNLIRLSKLLGAPA